MAGGEAPQAAATGAWCTACDEPLRLGGDPGLSPEFRPWIHVATGFEAGAGYGEDGWHIARPTRNDPALRADAEQAERNFPEFRVLVDGTEFRFTWRPEFAPPGREGRAYHARNCHELKMKLAAHLSLARAVTS